MILGGVVLAMSACKSPAPSAGSTTATTTTTTATATPVEMNERAQRYVLKGKVTTTRKYCGGARPTDEILQEFNTPQPAVGMELYLKEGATGNLSAPILDTIVTNADGEFRLKLPLGDYVIVDAKHADKSHYRHLKRTYADKTDNYEPIDMGCLEKWAAQTLMNITVTEQDVMLNTINIQIGCSWDEVPCATYTGPYPP